jgi:acetyl-CoA carboxylase biotin carboxyl carrier protein
LDFQDIERLLDLAKQHDLAELELERDGLKLRIRKAGAGYPPLAAPVQMSHAPAAAPPQLSHGPVSPSPAHSAGGDDSEDLPLELAVVKSPIVGTFYRSPEPGAPPFVEVGEKVKKDQVLCIIEAMKLMNEITSEYDGEIVSAYVENGKPVQYGERLFAIRTT